MILDALFLLSSVIATPSYAGIRLFNPHEFAVTATLQCGSGTQEVQVEAGDVIDLAGCAGAELIGAPVPLTMIETGIGERGDSQRLRTAGASCPSPAIEAPLFGCKGGTVIVGVRSASGSEVHWSVDGAAILSGQGTPQAVIQLGEGPSARIGVTVAGSCAATGEAAVAIRNPIVIESFDVPEIATADQETTVRWSFVPGTVPLSQALLGSALESPVALDPAARSYTWKPRLSGARTIELRASLQKAIVTRPVKRRAAGSRAGASACPATHMEKRIEVRGCSALSASISAPESVEEGSVFKASVELDHGEIVHWNVFGGTILEGADEETVTVQAPEDRDLGVTLTATVSSSPGCSTTADTSLTVVERAICATSRPNASLEVESVSCDAVTVKATFTGTPPFRGLWPDGTTFETQSTTLRHDFKNAGTAYFLRTFRDAYCSGTWTPSERVDHFGAGVSVHTVGGTCPGATAVATFTGTPPFTGKWASGEWFTTSQYTLEKPNLAGGETVAIEYLSDATCPRVYANSKSILIERPPTIRIWDRSMCATDFGPETSILVDVNGGSPPFTIYWSDGVMTTGGPNDRLLVRPVRVEQDSAFTIDRVSSRTCDAELPPERTITVQVRKNARIEGGTSSRVICDKQIATASLAAGPIPGATIQWSHSSGQILSGQGTDQITYSVNPPGGTLKVDVAYPDNECTTSQLVWTAWSTQGKITKFEVIPSTISRGGRAKVYVSTDSYIDFWSIGTVPSSRHSGLDIPGSTCGAGTCAIDFVDLAGPGTVDFTLSADGPCTAPLAAVTRLTIVP